MYNFKNLHISIATVADIAVITALLNSAYRGESSKMGWTSETHLIAGNVRTDADNLKKVLEQSGSIIVKFTNEQKEITGCVNLQQHKKKLYLGLFSVAPKSQGFGIGKQLLKAAEEYAQHLQCSSIYMTVITARVELIDWYQRHGYQDTRERKLFVEDSLTGKHLQTLEFMILEKVIGR